MGAAFLALVAGAENLEKFFFGPGWLWIVGGTILAAVWAYQSYCDGDQP